MKNLYYFLAGILVLTLISAVTADKTKAEPTVIIVKPTKPTSVKIVTPGHYEKGDVHDCKIECDRLIQKGYIIKSVVVNDMKYLIVAELYGKPITDETKSQKVIKKETEEFNKAIYPFNI